jgi:flagellum-specific peptidoglycan hydrolase FlgJ
MKNKTLLIIFTLLLILITSNVILHYNVQTLNKHHSVNQPKYSYPYDCIKEAELQYWDYKYLLSNEIQNYINTIAPASNLRAYALIEECEKYNIDIKFVLAQGEIESHFGTKGIGGKLNNVFNVGVFDNTTADKVHKNYKYQYANESIEPYLKLLTTRYLVDKLETDLMQNYVDINGNRYASDKLYEAKLRDKYNTISTSTKIDEYQALMRSYAIKCNRL